MPRSNKCAAGSSIIQLPLVQGLLDGIMLWWARSPCRVDFLVLYRRHRNAATRLLKSNGPHILLITR